MALILTGFKELDNLFKALPRSMDHKTWSAINYDRSKIIVSEIKSNTPVGATHNLINSIGSVKLSEKRTELGAVRTGARMRGKNKGFVANILHGGFKTRLKSGRKGKARVGENPFIKRSWDRVKGRVEVGLADSARKVIIRTAKRFLK